MCSRVAMKDFIMAHHEMAHIQYFLHYRHLPKVFRDGANPGEFVVLTTIKTLTLFQFILIEKDLFLLSSFSAILAIDIFFICIFFTLIYDRNRI